MPYDYSDYKALIRQFTSGLMDARHFEAEYLAMFKKETRQLSEDAYLILDRLFSDVDCFTKDETLIAENPGFYIGQDALLDQAKQALVRLEALNTSRNSS